MGGEIWDLPASAKFIGLTSIVTAVLLLTYQLIVRSTPLGVLLNGKRIRPSTTRRNPT
jgi:hypothetical protein